MTEHYLGTNAAAEHLGITRQAFLHLKDDLPEPDVMIGKTRGWSKQTLDDFDLHRRRRGRYPSTKADKLQEDNGAD